MRSKIQLGAALLLGLAAGACTAPNPPVAAARPAGASLVAAPAATAASVPPPAYADARSRLAGLADRGELLSYSRATPARRESGFVWHRVGGISQAHARAATAGGRLRLTTPSGQLLDYAYEEQVRHDNGDWTWVGRAANGNAGERATVTFGADAVFGTFAVPGQSALRLITRDGAAWAVEADPAAAQPAAAAAAAAAPDYLIPPTVAADKLPDAPAAANTDPAMRLVDLVVGYTEQGPRSVVMTHLNDMMSFANSILRSSGVKARLRMVNATYVDYYVNDANDQITLRKLTGSPTVAPDPAFAGLRATREQFGGDLAVLVRDMVGVATPGCGASWLLGANLKGIEAGDAAYGYSVVKNASGCSDMYFLHQIAHNLGAQHDLATASAGGSVEYGAYPYSFDYVGATFHTALAASSTTRPMQTLSNPRRSCAYAGDEGPPPPCGTAEADNVLTLQQTIPIVSRFRRKLTRGGFARYDTDGDGNPELFWRNKGQQLFAYWSGMSPQQSSQAFGMVSAYRVAGIGDFTGDGRADVLWRSDLDRFLVLWVAVGEGFEQRIVGGYEPGMHIVGVGDFNRDERYDLLWRNYTTGQMKVWAMREERIVEQAVAPMPGWMEILGIGDFNGDGYSDVVYADGANVNLYVNDAMRFTGAVVAGHPGWTYVATGDYNGDGRDDMYWANPAGDTLSRWVMDGPRITANPSQTLRAGHQLAGVVRGPGHIAEADVIWDVPKGGTSVGERNVGRNTLINGFDFIVYHQYPVGWELHPMR
ncbi:FG-GAP-like repeat-containing protein [Lysobacter antibioticus]|uniref:FG-GAP-like repeat-containing protein n=1 Tax=Lysobacter antibioticus TaxID=84531 RepID=UPI0004D00539|nr:FG-GAP-like repeat-containing protein [Lysobacter antibioticus]